MSRVRTLVKSEDYQGVKNEVNEINVIKELFLNTLHIPLLKIVYNVETFTAKNQG